MTYKIIEDVRIKTLSGMKTLKRGQIIKLSELSAKTLVGAGKIEPVFEPTDNLNERMAIMGENCEPEQVEPYVTEYGILVIPWNSPQRYWYWAGGQSVCDTLKELGRCNLIPKYKSPYSDN